MCGRFSQTRTYQKYATQLGWQQVTGQPEEGLKYNIPPGTYPLAFHALGQEQKVERLFWGYKPNWYQRAPLINARLDTILKNSAMWRPLLTQRIIIPADGWFEWTGPKGEKQPWYIHLKKDEPLFMAAITAWLPSKAKDEAHGFAIITDDAAGGMVDIHDRRPIVLRAEDALEWLDPEVPLKEALAILSTARPEDAFSWHSVSKKIGNSRYQNPDATAPA